MPTSPADDWECHRTNGQHLTAEEIEFVEAAFRARRPARDVAREIKCSSRVVQTRYAKLRLDRRPPPGITHYVKAGVRLTPEQLADQKVVMTAPRSLTAELFGDPAPGRSALDRRGEQV